MTINKQWGQKNNKFKKRNNQMRNPKQPSSEPNDSDSSISSASSSQVHDMRSTRTQKVTKYNKDNGTTGTIRRTPSTKAPMITRASMAKNSATHALGHSDVHLSTSLTNTSLTPSLISQVSNVNPVPSQSDFCPAPIFSQPVMDSRKVGIADQLNPKMQRTNLKS